MTSPEAIFVKDAERLVEDARKYRGELSERKALIRQLDLLRRQLEHPMDNMTDDWVTLNAITALNFMVETGVFEKMPLEGSIPAQELSKRAMVEESAIVRLMRVLVGKGVIEETEEDKFAHTAISREYLPGGSVDFFRLCTAMMPCYLSLPKYFATHKATDLLDPRKTPFSYSHDSEGKTFYEVLTDNPEEHKIFNKAMKQQEPFLPTTGMFPFGSMKEKVENEKERPFIVDVGGGRGHMLSIIRKETAEGYGGKMILQDLPQVLDSVSDEEIPGIQKMAHDFNTPQPVKNAHIYYLRRILHTYQDEKCIKILQNIALAMGPRSRILIGEIVLPTKTKVFGEMTGYWKDVVMLTIGGKERSEKDYANILDAAGLQLVKVWPFETGEQAVVEARLKIS